MKNLTKILIAALFILVLAVFGAATIPNPGHKASTIGGDNDEDRTFFGTLTEKFIFPGPLAILGDLLNVTKNLFVLGNVTIGDIGSNSKVTVFGDLNVTGASYFGSQSFVNIDATGNIDVAGNVTASRFIGEGGSITGIMPSMINITSTKYNGSLVYSGLVGYQAANAICNATFAGSYWCQTNDIILVIKNKDISYFGDAGWGAGDAAGWIANGPPGYTANANDCLGMTSALSTSYGTFWSFSISGGGNGGISLCDAKKKLACCRG
jgi:hypothetical protein